MLTSIILYTIFIEEKKAACAYVETYIYTYTEKLLYCKQIIKENE